MKVCVLNFENDTDNFKDLIIFVISKCLFLCVVCHIRNIFPFVPLCQPVFSS